MEEHDTSTVIESLDLSSFIRELVNDLRELRAGKISTHDAKVRAELARQILRGVHHVLTAQKFLAAQALPAPTKSEEGP